MAMKTTSGAPEMPQPRSRQRPEVLPLTSYEHRTRSDHFEPRCSITMPGAEFARSVEQVSVASWPLDCAHYLDTWRQGMLGILADFREPGRVRMAAMDRWRIAVKDIRIEGASGELPPGEGILPAGEMREVARLALESGARSVEIEISEDGQVRLHVASEELLVLYISAGYHRYREAWSLGF